MKVYLKVTLEANLLDEQPGRTLSPAAALTAARDGVKEALNRAASNGFNHKYSDTIGLAIEDVAVVVGDKPENAEGEIVVEQKMGEHSTPPALLHVYAQDHEHDELYVIGNRGGLEKLKKAVEKALAQDVGKESVMTNDGEGFDAIIALCDENWQSEAWVNMQEPYVAESSMDAREKAVSPWAYVRSKKKC